MTIKYIFHNFTDEPFTGYWNGRAYTFKPGTQKEYPKGIAEHFAKHLANQVLTKLGKPEYTSPKKPQEVPAFMEVFSKALMTQEIPDEGNLDIDDGLPKAEEPSMNIRTTPRAPVDPYDANAQPQAGPGAKPQIVGNEIGGEDESAEYEEPAAKQ